MGKLHFSVQGCMMILCVWRWIHTSNFMYLSSLTPFFLYLFILLVKIFDILYGMEKCLFLCLSELTEREILWYILCISLYTITYLYHILACLHLLRFPFFFHPTKKMEIVRMKSPGAVHFNQ